MEFGCITERIRARINELAEKLPVIVDSRSRIGLYRNCYLKPNEIECARALQMEETALKEGTAEEALLHAAKELYEKCSAKGIFLTLGSRGALFFKDGFTTRVPAVPVEPPVDIVGAGDCFLSALSLAMTATENTETAMRFAAMASAICVKKLGTTGTASPEELRGLC